MFTTALSRSQRGGASDGGDGTCRWWRLSGAEAEGVAESDIADCSDDRRREVLSQQRDREGGSGRGLVRRTSTYSKRHVRGRRKEEKRREGKKRERTRKNRSGFVVSLQT